METTNTEKEWRIETSFKNALVECQKGFLTESLTDNEIFPLDGQTLCTVMEQLTSAPLESDVLVKLLAFYLMNSDDDKEKKKMISEDVAAFVRLADCVANRQTELRVINAAFVSFEDRFGLE